MAYNISVNNSVTGRPDCLKLLSVTIDSGLNLSNCVRSIYVKASQGIGVIKRLRNLIRQRQSYHYIYKLAILPYLTNWHLAWNFGNAKLQSWKGCKGTTIRLYQWSLLRTSLPTRDNWRHQDIFILIWKKLPDFIPKRICCLFKKRTPNHNLCNPRCVLHNIITVNFGKHWLRHLVWNYDQSGDSFELIDYSLVLQFFLCRCALVV